MSCKNTKVPAGLMNSFSRQDIIGSTNGLPRQYERFVNFEVNVKERGRLKVH
jgi:hypothetical protein